MILCLSDWSAFQHRQHSNRSICYFCTYFHRIYNISDNDCCSKQLWIVLYEMYYCNYVIFDCHFGVAYKRCSESLLSHADTLICKRLWNLYDVVVVRYTHWLPDHKPVDICKTLAFVLSLLNFRAAGIALRAHISRGKRSMEMMGEHIFILFSTVCG